MDVQKQIEAQIGALLVANINLASMLEQARARIAELEAQAAEISGWQKTGEPENGGE